MTPKKKNSSLEILQNSHTLEFLNSTPILIKYICIETYTLYNRRELSI